MAFSLAENRKSRSSKEAENKKHARAVFEWMHATLKATYKIRNCEAANSR